MNKSNLHRLISPKSIAVVGNRGANFAIRESLKLGYSHQIWAVHPYLESLEGIKCFKDIKDLPEVPDATFIAVNAESAIEVVSDLKSMGGGGAVLYASGFGEVGREGSGGVREGSGFWGLFFGGSAPPPPGNLYV